MNRFAIRAVLIGILGNLPGAASAVPITFIHQGVGSGSLASAPFSTRGFAITAAGDTSQRVGVAGVGYYIDHLSAQIEIDGLGLFLFATPTRTFVNQTAPSAGFSRAGERGLDLFNFNGPEASVFATWGMTTSIGPVSGTGLLTQWNSPPVETSGGVLFFNVDTSVPAVFTAVIPEPGVTTPLTAVLAAGLWFRRRERRRAKSAP